MRPETAAFLEKARVFLAKAHGLLEGKWTDEAGRAAYLAGFHAAQALLFESAGDTFKTHSGVQAEFARRVKDDPRIDVELRRFLGRAYNLKAIADYETGPGSHVTADQASEAIQTAGRFVECIEGMISSDASPSSCHEQQHD